MVGITEVMSSCGWKGWANFGACLATKACIQCLYQQPDFQERPIFMASCQVDLTAFRQFATSVRHSCGSGSEGSFPF